MLRSSVSSAPRAPIRDKIKKPKSVAPLSRIFHGKIKIWKGGGEAHLGHFSDT